MLNANALPTNSREACPLSPSASMTKPNCYERNSIHFWSRNKNDSMTKKSIHNVMRCLNLLPNERCKNYFTIIKSPFKTLGKARNRGSGETAQRKNEYGTTSTTLVTKQNLEFFNTQERRNNISTRE